MVIQSISVPEHHYVPGKEPIHTVVSSLVTFHVKSGAKEFANYDSSYSNCLSSSRFIDSMDHLHYIIA